ncbi:MAG TPA: DUF1073 domain-containing protein [Caulobacteraceae bacterium]|jgi:hypothetical protein|nr:DUF1073 domain-containing protein [Caulobacteraceae bacterium]
MSRWWKANRPSWYRGAAPEPVKTAPSAERPPMDIKAEAIVRLNARGRALANGGAFATVLDTFKAYEPPPGVLPEVIAADGKTKALTGNDVALAADFDIDIAANWAVSGGWDHEGLRFPGFAYLAELAQRPEYRKAAETYGKEMTREWVRFVSTAEDDDKADRIAELDEAMKQFRVRDVFRKAAEHDGFFGRGHIFIDLGDDQDTDAGKAELATPLIADKRKIKRGALKGFRAVEPIWTYPAAYNARNPLAPDFFRPRAWYVMGREIHRDRLLTLISRPVPDLLKPSYAFSGLSLSQMGKPYVDNWLRTRQSVSDTLNAFSIMVLKTNMSGLLNGGSAEIERLRAEAFNLFRSNLGLMEIDFETEDLFNVAAPLGTLDALQAQAQEQMASVWSIPLVKLLGTTPSGLNASSDGEIRVFYDNISAEQEAVFDANLKTVVRVVMLHLWGEIDEDIAHEWVPLWQLDQAAEAAVQKTKADTDAVLMDAGALAAEEVRKRLANDPKSGYHGLDVDDVPEPPDMGTGEEPSAGGNPARTAEPAKTERSPA